MAKIMEVGGRGKLHAEFNSVGEVFRAIDKLGWVPQHDMSSNDRGGGGGFHTFNSLDEAKDVFRNHPDRIRNYIMNDVRLTTPGSPGKEIEWDVTGDFIDMDRYMEGVPEVFGNVTMGNPRNIFCTINILGSFVWSTEPKYILARLSRVIRLVDWLEEQGVRCQITVSDDSEVAFISTTVKRFAEPLDLNELCVANHPDWLRRIEFLIMEQSKTWTWGYGSGYDYDNKMKNYEARPEDGMYIYVGGYFPTTIEDLERQFDKIEADVTEMLASGLTFNDRKLTITGGRW